ncbi:Na+/H+ antiporter family protein [Hyaloraphidium curvatum]|nr:Na+/H+ antiporter family protein [Hyaloraphidium curvatum]
MPGGVTIIPIIIVLILAFWTKEVMISLLFGVFLCAMFINNYNPIIGFERMLDTYMVNAIANKSRASIILFTFWIASLIALVQKSGGAAGLAQAITKGAKSRWSAQWLAYALGWVIFFDDYASCLIVGSQSRPITDSHFVSREKLAFITHTTSAGPASIVPLTSWVGFELSLLAESMAAVGDTSDPFNTLLATIPGRFFPWFMLFFIPVALLWKRDYGPMLAAERRAMNLHQLQPPSQMVAAGAAHFEEYEPEKHGGKPPHWINAVIPFFVTIATIIITLFLTGYYSSLDQGLPITASNMTGNGDSYAALNYGCFLGALVATIQYRILKLMTFREAINTWLQGIRGIIEALLVLILAWSISGAIDDLGTATWIVSAASGGGLDYRGLPALIFVLCCLISFCTGTSWGTMSIVFPLAIPLAWSLAPAEWQHVAIVDTAAAILSGSIFGDQCSPISDTSILSALASQVSVHAHVATQLPYAVTCAILAILVGLVPVGFHAYPQYAGLLIGFPVIGALVWLLGTPVMSDKPDKFEPLTRMLARFGKNKPGAAPGTEAAVEAADGKAVAVDADGKPVVAPVLTVEQAYGDTVEKYLEHDAVVPVGPQRVSEEIRRASVSGSMGRQSVSGTAERKPTLEVPGEGATVAAETVSEAATEPATTIKI